MKMIFDELYLFSPFEKKARKISFNDGLNIITSSQEDGNTRGKTVIMRSLYHVLGADSYFDAKWNTNNIIYILKFTIDSKSYYIYRYNSLFKIFNENLVLLSTSNERKALAKNLKELTGFSVMLPDRNNQKLEITPPVYNYLPYYLDQDKHEGSNFSSYDSLGQYSNYKDSVLYYHFGVYDELYFSLIQKRERIEDKIRKYEKKLEITRSMISKIDSKIRNKSYEEDLESLRRDLDRYADEYNDKLSNLNQCKNTLIELRNDFSELEHLLANTEISEKKVKKDINQLKKCKCPECGSIIENTMKIKSKKYILADDYIIAKNDISLSLNEISSQIRREENNYIDCLSELKKYEERLNINNKRVEDILQYKGYCEIRESFVTDESKISRILTLEYEKKEKLNKELKKYSKKKTDVHKKYYELLSEAKIKFDLNELSDNKFKKLSSVIKGSGANKDIVTLIWYFTIIKIRNAFNSNVIQYPLVLDSPCNTEMDDNNREETIKYIFENTNLSSQVIISGIGLEKYIPKDKPSNTININNDKYKLLLSEDYEECYELLKRLCDAE